MDEWQEPSQKTAAVGLTNPKTRRSVLYSRSLEHRKVVREQNCRPKRLRIYAVDHDFREVIVLYSPSQPTKGVLAS